MYGILDIETKPNDDLRELFKERNPNKSTKYKGTYDEWVNWKMSTNVHYCRIVCIVLHAIVPKKNMASTIVYAEGENYKDFKKFAEDMKRFVAGGGMLVTFNGKSFDIPAIVCAGKRLGWHLPYRWLYQGLHPYDRSRHLDLFTEFKGWGHKWPNLDELLRIYCNTQKETLGDEFFQTATDLDLIKHCVEDVHFTAALFYAFKDMWGIS